MTYLLRLGSRIKVPAQASIMNWMNPILERNALHGIRDPLHPRPSLDTRGALCFHPVGLKCWKLAWRWLEMVVDDWG